MPGIQFSPRLAQALVYRVNVSEARFCDRVVHMSVVSLPTTTAEAMQGLVVFSHQVIQ